MAIDNQNKRMSMITMGSPVPMVMPTPSAGFNTREERFQLVYLYPASSFGLFPDEIFYVGDGLNWFFGQQNTNWMYAEQKQNWFFVEDD